MESHRVIGCMTGTSLDGLDIALVEITGRGLEAEVKFMDGKSFELPKFKKEIREITFGKKISIEEFIQIQNEYSLFIAEKLKLVMSEWGPANRIGVHGQTVYHKPPNSLQMLNGNIIAANLQTEVWYDFRGVDLALEGQGAPITPIADYVLFRGYYPRAIINLGGFCNLTSIPNKDGLVSEIEGKDVCVCNQLLNALYSDRCTGDFDQDGQLASQGKVDQEFLQFLVQKLKQQRLSNRSLGTGDEMQELLTVARDYPIQNVLYSACQAIALQISLCLKKEKEVILAGGGAFHRLLVELIEQNCHAKVFLSSVLGVPIEYREAAEFAVLAQLCEDRVAITLEKVTGVKKRLVSGVRIKP